MTNKYEFYYDESFHDRKITYKNDKPNIFKNDSSDIYVGVFIGGEKKELNQLFASFEKFEERMKEELSFNNKNKELKGTTIGKKNLKYGFASCNKKALKFYSEYFSLFKDNITLHFSLLSKSSFILEKIFKNFSNDEYSINKHAFIYSVIKFLYTYKFYDIFKLLFEETKDNTRLEVVRLIEKRMNNIISAASTSKKKKIEVKALTELVKIMHVEIANINTEIEYHWDYTEVFKGFNMLLKEINIDKKDILVYIDNEINTEKAANEGEMYKEVISCKSENTIGIRVSDIFSNFIGRFIFSLTESLKGDSIIHCNDIERYDFNTKKLLNKEWFNIKEEQFTLYKLIANIWNKQGKNYYCAYINSFFDYQYFFFLFFYYIDQHLDFKEFNSKSSAEHTEYFNTYCCENLEERYKLFV